MNKKLDLTRIFSPDLYQTIDKNHVEYLENFFEQMRCLIELEDLHFYSTWSTDLLRLYREEYLIISGLNIDINKLTKGKVVNFQSLLDRQLGKNNENYIFILTPFLYLEGRYLYNFVSSLLYILFQELKELSPEYYENLGHG